MATLPRLLLIGCGYAHLFVLEALARGRLTGVRATLVSPAAEYFYSGMIPGVIAGCYHPEAARVRPPRLLRAAGAEWVRGRVARVGAAARRVHLEEEASSVTTCSRSTSARAWRRTPWQRNPWARHVYKVRGWLRIKHYDACSSVLSFTVPSRSQ